LEPQQGHHSEIAEIVVIASIPLFINYYISKEEEKQNENEYYSKNKSRKHASTKFKLFLP